MVPCIPYLPHSEAPAVSDYILHGEKPASRRVGAIARWWFHRDIHDGPTGWHAWGYETWLRGTAQDKFDTPFGKSLYLVQILDCPRSIYD